MKKGERKKKYSRSPLASTAYVCRLFVTQRPNYKYSLRSYFTYRANSHTSIREEQRRTCSVLHRVFLYYFFYSISRCCCSRESPFSHFPYFMCQITRCNCSKIQWENKANSQCVPQSELRKLDCMNFTIRLQAAISCPQMLHSILAILQSSHHSFNFSISGVNYNHQ